MATTDKKKNTISSRIAGVVFGLLFFSAGAAVAYFLVLPDLHDWISARNFISVPAQLNSVTLHQHSSSDGGPTYSVSASYTYTFNGQSFTGTRVGISTGADNIGGYQRQMYKRLKPRERGEVAAWVDPSDPRRSLLDREMRWGLFAFKSVFATLFMLVGGAVAFFSARASQRSDTPATAPVVQQPSGRITSNTRSAMRLYWFMAIFWNLVSTPGLFVLPRELAKGNWPALLILIFALVGLWLLYKAVHATLQWRRFGAIALTLSPYPGSIGGGIRATVDLPERLPASQPIRVTMTCVHRRTTGSGKNRRTSEKALWQSETTAQSYAAGRGMQLTFSFNVPADLPPSGTRSDDYHAWTIDLSADIPGVDLDSRFEVPMMQVASSAATVTTTAAPTSSTTPPEIPANLVRVQNERGATVFYYPLFRQVGMAIGLLFFGAIFFVPVVLMIKSLHGSLMDAVLWVMIALFTLIGAFLVLLGLYELGNTLHVEISPRGLRTLRRVYGFPFARNVPLSDITAIETKIGTQSNSAGKINVRYNLLAHTAGGGKITVGDNIPGPALAEHLAQLVRKACGLQR